MELHCRAGDGAGAMEGAEGFAKLELRCWLMQPPRLRGPDGASGGKTLAMRFRPQRCSVQRSGAGRTKHILFTAITAAEMLRRTLPGCATSKAIN